MYYVTFPRILKALARVPPTLFIRKLFDIEREDRTHSPIDRKASEAVAIQALMGETVSCQLSRLVHTAGSFMRSCGQCGGYVLVCGPLREPTMSRVETLPDEPAWHESKEHACGIRATNGKEGV